MLLFFEATWLSALAILWVLGSLEIMTREGCLFEDFPSRSSELDLSGNKRIYENDGRIRGWRRGHTVVWLDGMIWLVLLLKQDPISLRE
jgi:hypothetical protein